MKKPSIIFLFISISLLTACNHTGGSKNAVQTQLLDSFEQLYLVKFGLNFPANRNHLKACKTNNDQSCLNAFQSVVDAKKAIKSIPADKALPSTLNLIKKSCSSDDEFKSNNLCYGALISLYLYNSKLEDHLMRE